MGLQLQSPQLETFVVAVIIAALLFADRLGGSDTVMRRLYQVAVSLALVFTVFAATSAFLPGPDLSSLVQFDEPDFTESSERAREVATIHVAVAFALVLGGLMQLSRYKTAAPGVVLGGVLLLLSSGDTGGVSDPSTLSALFMQGDSDQARDIIYFAVLLAGAGPAVVWRAPLGRSGGRRSRRVRLVGGTGIGTRPLMHRDEEWWAVLDSNQ